MRIFGAEFDFKPCTSWTYSNCGFTLLALSVQRVAGQGFHDYVQEHIFDAAGMSSTSYGPEEKVPNHALKYYRDPQDNQWKIAEFFRGSRDRGGGPGGAYLPVEDMSRFGHALLEHRLLDADHTQLLTTGKVRVGTRGNRYAYGFQDYEVNGVRWVGHGGGGPPANAEFRAYPEPGYVVVVFANMGPSSAMRAGAFVGDRLTAN